MSLATAAVAQPARRQAVAVVDGAHRAVDTLGVGHVSRKWPAPDRRAFDFVSALDEISDGARLAEVSARYSSAGVIGFDLC